MPQPASGLINPNRTRRASRYQRPQPIPMHLTQRDEQIIKRCWEDKLLSTSDLQKLFFGARARCIHRLKLLYSNGYVDRYFLPVLWPYRGATEALYTIGTRGDGVVSLQLGLDKTYIARTRREFRARMQSPSFLLTFRHLRTINHTRIRIQQAFELNQACQLVQWIPERLLEERFQMVQNNQPRRTKLRADGFLQYQHVQTGKLYSGFVEVDLGTMSKRQIEAKIERYLAYFATRHPEQKYRTRWFRVLFITTHPERAEQLWSTISQQASSIFWLTSFQELDASDWLSRGVWFRAGHEGRHSLLDSLRVSRVPISS